MNLKMIKTNKSKVTVLYLVAFLIPFAVMSIGCIYKNIFPFGNQSFLRTDMYNQYLQFFTSMYDKFKDGEGLAYSMQLGLGSGTAAIYGYYLSSPINWLVLLMPRAYIAEFMTVVVVIKMGISGTTFAHYLRKHFGKTDVSILFFSCAYALSGFMAAYQWNIMWLDVIFLAPLVLGALEELVETGKGAKYCGLLALSIFSNFYLSVMLCIFLVLYFITLILWKSWNIKWRRCLQFAGYSLLAGAITLVLLLPVYFALSQTAYSSATFPSTLEWYMNFFELMARHSAKVTMQINDYHNPNIYCSVAIMILIPLYVWNRNISRKEKGCKLALVAIFLLSFMCNMLDFIWHGMNFPTSLPGRQAYLYIWLLLVMGYEVYLNLNVVRLREIFVSGAVGYALIAIAGLKTTMEGIDTWTFGMSLGAMRIYFAILLIYCVWQIPAVPEYFKGQKWLELLKKIPVSPKIFVLILVVAELTYNMYQTSIITTTRGDLLDYYAASEDAVAWLKEQDPSLYRTEIVGRKTKNDNMMWDLNTSTIFSSTIDSRVGAFYKSLGMGTTSVAYWDDGATPLASAMLGVKYKMAENTTLDPELYEFLYTEGAANIYKCKYTLPMTYVVDPDLEDSWVLEEFNPIKAQNDLCHLLGIEGDLLVPVASTKISDQQYQVTAPEDMFVYAYLGDSYVAKASVTNGAKSTTYSQLGFKYLVDMGKICANETATLTAVETDRTFERFEAYAVNFEVLEQAIQKLNENSMNITEYGEGYLEGDITLDEPGNMIVTFPIDDGWKLYVDGEETQVSSFENALLSVPLDAGSHHIVLVYEMPGFAIGLVLSIISLLIWGGCFFWERKHSGLAKESESGDGKYSGK